ncbi:glycosyltransferase family 4 protein [Skermanella rosea]|uniref:glycosyltransferase family 4 protein n=1 Tax=Skermanella rosea TaxID=1817965 RepID=UPI00193389F8|nr:glycosyltransferase family 4 protein [Skermanella rosea]UEM04541.1 glycosyltransferase family 4 protein [Skermanella rosea]
MNATTPRLRLVLLITHMDQGGAQEALLRLGRSLRSRGHDVETWFLYEKSPLYRNEDNIRVLLPVRSPGAVGYLQLMVRLFRQLRAHRPDAVISFLPLANGFGQAVARLAGVPRRVASQRNPSWTYTPWMQRLDRLAGTLGCYTANVGNSQSVVDSFAAYPQPYRRHLTVVHNGIDWRSSELDPAAARARFGLPAGGPLILNIGRLAEQKNQSLLLRVLPSLSAGHLVLAGDGNDRGKLERLAADLGVTSRVIFLGEVARAAIPDLLRAADIFAMPTLFEGQSNAVLEAMHAGLAIVSSDIPAQVETLGGSGEDAVGDLLPLDDDGAWTRSLEALVRDPALRALMAERARARAQLFTVDRMTDGFERLVDISAPEGRVFSPQAGLRQRS